MVSSSGGMLGTQYVGGLGLAKSKPLLSMETSCWEADPSDQGFVPWGTSGTRMIASCRAHSLCPLDPGTHMVFVSSPHRSSSLHLQQQCATLLSQPLLDSLYVSPNKPSSRLWVSTSFFSLSSGDFPLQLTQLGVQQDLGSHRLVFFGFPFPHHCRRYSV